MCLEPARSLQAQFFFPMDVPLGFGTLGRTVFTLSLVPCMLPVADELNGPWLGLGQQATTSRASVTT